MNRAIWRFIGKILPKPLKTALKRRLNAMADARFHGRARGRFHYTSFDERGELQIDHLSLALPQPFADSAGQWLANHPEDILELEVFTKIAKLANGTMLDIGAHVGTFAVLFCTVCDRDAIAVEPITRFQKTIPLTAKLNHIRKDRVQVIAAAVSNKAGVINMHLEDETGFAQMRKYKSSRGSSNATIAVQATTIDAIRSTIAAKIAMLKIDVEGFEDEVLEGARETIARDRPIILLELHNEYLAERGLDLWSVLDRKEQNYSLLRLDGRGIKPATVIRTILPRTHLVMVPMEQFLDYQALLTR